jgi:hypothetical protein
MNVAAEDTEDTKNAEDAKDADKGGGDGWGLNGGRGEVSIVLA